MFVLAVVVSQQSISPNGKQLLDLFKIENIYTFILMYLLLLAFSSYCIKIELW